MKDIQSRLRTLLGRNLFLEKDVKQTILDADREHQLEILPTLENMDNAQTRMFGKVLAKNPTFLDDYAAWAKKQKHEEA